MKCSFLRGELQCIVKVPEDANFCSLSEFYKMVSDLVGFDPGDGVLCTDRSEMEISEDLVERLWDENRQEALPSGNADLEYSTVAVSTRCFDSDREWTVLCTDTQMYQGIDDLNKSVARKLGITLKQGQVRVAQELEVTQVMWDQLCSYYMEFYTAEQTKTLMSLVGPKVNKFLPDGMVAVSSKFVPENKIKHLHLTVDITIDGDFEQMSVSCDNASGCDYGDTNYGNGMTATSCGMALAEYLRTYCEMEG